MSPTQQQFDSTQPQELAAIGSSTDEQLSEEKPESPTTATSPVATVQREEAPHSVKQAFEDRPSRSNSHQYTRGSVQT